MAKHEAEFPPLCVGDRVRRGPDWEWGDQDCNEDGEQQEGEVIAVYSAGSDLPWFNVKWDSGADGWSYRYGPSVHDVQKVASFQEKVRDILQRPDGLKELIIPLKWESPIKQPSRTQRAKAFLHSL